MAAIEVTNTGENWKQWTNAKITVILKSTIDNHTEEGLRRFIKQNLRKAVKKSNKL